MKDKMNSNHFHMHQPPFASPWPPRHRYPPPHPRFLNNQTFYPSSVPQFPHPKPRFQDPLPIRQCNSSYNSRVFPEINNCHHLYPNELPCNFPPSVHNPQSTLLDSTQDNAISSNILESSQQRCLENGFSRSPDHCRTYEGNHDSHPSHRMYCHPPLHLKPEPAGDSDSLKTDKEILYSPLVKDDQSDYSNYGLPVYTAITYPEEINPHFKPDSHFYARSEYYDESYKYAESKIEGHSCNKQDLEEKINHSKLNSSEKEDSKSLKKLMLENSSKVKNTFRNANKETKSKENFCSTEESLEKSNPKRQKFTEEKREARYHERKGIGNHSSESKRSRNCSSKQKQSEDYNYDRRTKNLSSEQKQSRNYHREKEKSKNSNHERKGLKDQRKEKQMSGNDVADFKILKDKCKKLKNVSTDSEQPRNFSRNHENSSNSSIVEKSRNISRGKEKSRDISRGKEKSRDISRGKEKSRDISKQRERSRNNKETERSRNNSKETEKSRNRRERSRSIIRESRNLRNPSKEWEQSISHSLKRKREKSTSTEKRKPRISSRERKRLHSQEKATTRKDVILPKKSHKYSSQVQNKGYHSSDNRSDSKLSKSHGTRHSKHDEGNGCAKTRISSAKSPETSKQNSSLNKENASTAKCTWMRSSPAELYYIRDENNHKVVIASQKLKDLHERFDTELVKRAERIKLSKPKYEPPRRKTKLRKPKPAKTENEESSSTSEESSSEEEDTSLEELERKKKHPYRLHEELWYNDPGEMNDGPLCRCSAKARRSGIRHGIYAGETSISLCDLYSNNADKLHHYHISITPITNFLSKTPTTIHHDGNDFMFEGFSILSHFEIPELPPCKVIRFNIEYTVHYVKEKFPENFTVAGLELFSHYLFTELLELVDLNWKAYDDSSGCHRFHLFPRFTRDIEANGKELLSLNVILQYLLDSNQLLIEKENLPHIMSLSKHKWQDVADKVKDMIVTCPGMKPSSIRVDQLDRELCDPKKNIYPEIVHFGVRPPQLSYAGNPNYQKAWRDYVKFRHLLANKPKVIYADRHRLLLKERRLQEMRMKNNLKRDVTVVISSEKFYKTGILCDVVQHAMLLPVLICHLRFHQSLDVLEARIGYKFKDRYLLQLALTHPSYRENFGTNPDHARNSLTNCGIRQPEYGDRRIHYMNTRKRGINTLINIMSRFGRREETTSRINHNERLEFLGDAVVEFLSSIHLFFMFSNLEEGGLATYRAAIVQNQHLAVLAKNLQLEKFMLYAHGSDLCHDLELRHAMANCFEALMGALFLDGGIDVADRVFSETLFIGIYLEEWVNYPLHPLQELEPCGDRKWIPEVHILQKLNKFEESIGIEFTHIRLLARAMTHRSLGYNNLTMGSNQRLEFLGDTVLQLVASEYLYKYFPEHHEGHLSLLRSSLVNNRTQAVVCDDLGMVEYAIYPYAKVELKAKDRADLLEAFLGALYVDKDLSYCTKFCEVCFFPRLQDFIMNQEWNDPKSKLQQCCLTLRTMDGGEPDIPVYKVIECKGPTNTRVYSVAVYFRRRRLAVGSGHSIQQAEMSAAENALGTSKDLFPQLDHQRRAIEKSLNQRKPNKREHKRK